MLQRIRTIKQEFFRHEGLFDLERETGFPIRVAFCGLWTCCDREGRFEWRPRVLKTMIIPYDDVDFSRVLYALATRGFLVKYEVGGQEYGLVPSFRRHQVINNRESESSLPAPGQEPLPLQSKEALDACGTRSSRDDDATGTPLVHAQAERNGTGTERNRTEKDSCAATSAPPSVASVITLPLNDGVEYPVTADQVSEWQALYLAVDVPQELRNMRGWLSANRSNRKTKSGILRFVTGWLAKEQNKTPRMPIMSMQTSTHTQQPPECELPADIDEQAGQKLWSAACEKLCQSVNAHSFETWLRPVRAAGIAAGILYLSVPTQEFLLITEKYGQQIEEIVDLDLKVFVRVPIEEFYRVPKRPSESVSQAAGA